MRHRIDGKKLSRTTSHRRALWRNMAAALIQHGAIRTTEAKAKQLRRFVEKLITTARVNTLHARRLVLAELPDRELFDDDGDIEEKTLIAKLFEEVAPRYVNRDGGYTRIIRLAERRLGDGGKQVLLQLVEEESIESTGGGGTRRRKRATARHEAVAAAVKAAPQAAGADQADEEEAPQDADADAPAKEVADDAGEAESSDDTEAEGDAEKTE